MHAHCFRRSPPRNVGASTYPFAQQSSVTLCCPAVNSIPTAWIIVSFRNLSAGSLATKALVLNLWGLHISSPAYQIFIIRFVTVAKLQLWCSNVVILWLGRSPQHEGLYRWGPALGALRTKALIAWVLRVRAFGRRSCLRGPSGVGLSWMRLKEPVRPCQHRSAPEEASSLPSGQWLSPEPTCVIPWSWTLQPPEPWVQISV